jgi:hypothetical protein
MTARQAVIGAQLGENAFLARIELYKKDYHDLAQLGPNQIVTGGGTGSSRGADVFLKGGLPGRIAGRISYSYVDAKRTDPITGMRARAPFDVTNSFTLVADKSFGVGWSASGAVRYATGKPYTPITGATFDQSRSLWVPQYSAPYSERLAPLERVDLSLSRYMRLSPQTFLVMFASVNNLFDRVNIYEYRYSADYSQRIPIRSLFNRSFYVGGSISFTAQ